MPVNWTDCAFYCGTFNPVHIGHLMVAQQALRQGNFRRVVFVPAGQPPHRAGEPDMLAARHRLNLVRLATADNPAFAVWDGEVHRAGQSYTIDTLRFWLAQGWVGPPAPLIIGTDALAGLATWKDPAGVASLAHFWQAPRPGCMPVQFVEVEGHRVSLSTTVLDSPPSALSSTWIRQALHMAPAHALRYALPAAVLRYIADNGLYQAGKNRIFP